GYPEALAEFWVLCGRMGYAERHLVRLGITTATLRRLRYLELPPWPKVAPAARQLCRSEKELSNLKQLWNGTPNGKAKPSSDGFGPRVQQLRKEQGMTRRQLADLFGIGGKKPARIIKYIEEDGFYSAQAHPAGLAALLCSARALQARLLQLWQERRKQFQ